jgi:Mg2+ and Co2+ transporter CorA
LQSVLYSSLTLSGTLSGTRHQGVASQKTLMMPGMSLNGDQVTFSHGQANFAHQTQPQFGALQFTKRFPFLTRKAKVSQQETDKTAPAVLKEPEKPAVDFAQLAKAIEKPNEENSARFIDNLFTTYPELVKSNNVLVVQDNGSFAGSPFRLVVKKGSTPDKNLIWLDIQGDTESRVFKRMAETFTLTDFQKENPENSDIPYDIPVIDHDSIQMTVYCMRLEKGTPQATWDKMTRKQRKTVKPPGETLKKEEMYLYAGSHFLISVHSEKRPSIDKTIKLLADTGKDKTPAELMTFVVNENITRYSHMMSTLHADMSKINESASQKDIDRDTMINDCLKVGQKIDEMHYNVQQQLGVLNRLAELNEFHESPFVNPTRITQLQGRLEKCLAVLDHYQDVKEALDSNVQAKISNDMNWVMKKVASLGVLAIPTTSAGALWGMNVAVPGANTPEMFNYIAGGAGIATGLMFLALKRFKWL